MALTSGIFATNFVPIASEKIFEGAQSSGVIDDTELADNFKKTDQRNIVQSIGQVVSDFGETCEGDDGEVNPAYTVGTGTIVRCFTLNNADYAVVLTCAHNVADKYDDDEDEDEDDDDEDNKQDDEDIKQDEDKGICKRADHVWFLPDPQKKNIQLRCIDFKYHPLYDPYHNVKDKNDLAILLCKYDKHMYQEYENIPLKIPQFDDKIFIGEIFGYPMDYVKPKEKIGYLFGQEGDVKMVKLTRENFEGYKYGKFDTGKKKKKNFKA